jgi:hypothetical protein
VILPEDGKSGLTENSSGLVQPSDIVCNSVTVKNILYAKDMLVVIHVDNQDRILAGWVKKAVVRGTKVYLLLSAKVCRRTHFRYFQSEDTRGDLQLKSVSSLNSFKPLIPRGNESHYVFFLYGKLQDDSVS